MASAQPAGRAGKPGILRGGRMMAAVAAPRMGGSLTALLALGALLVLGSGAALFVLEARSSPQNAAPLLSTSSATSASRALRVPQLGRADVCTPVMTRRAV